MTDNIYSTPESNLDNTESKQAKALWNPDVAGAWSLIFTPIFGSILVYKNWKSIGDEERADGSKKWIYISIFMLLISAVVGLVGFIYIITWYFLSQKKQTQYIKHEFSGNYIKKSWAKPLLIAFACLFSFFLLVVFVTMGIDSRS